ncbi:MAG TPA: hypothetical protein VNT01_17320 [Symbiobacteriaceae bacterium]|nr:hypothetical protein [Symbiobacteriaceae bacterium]
MAVQIGRVEQEPGRLAEVRQEIEAGLARYLYTKGSERSALTIRLMRLQWEAEELEAANRVG